MCVWGNVNAGLGAEGRLGVLAVNCRDAQGGASARCVCESGVAAGDGAEGRWGILAVECRDAQGGAGARCPCVHVRGSTLGAVLRAVLRAVMGLMFRVGLRSVLKMVLGAVLRAGRAVWLAVIGTHSEGQVHCRRGAGCQGQGWAWGPDKWEAGERSCSCTACRAQGFCTCIACRTQDCCSYIACQPSRCLCVAPAKTGLD